MVQVPLPSLDDQLTNPRSTTRGWPRQHQLTSAPNDTIPNTMLAIGYTFSMNPITFSPIVDSPTLRSDSACWATFPKSAVGNESEEVISSSLTRVGPGNFVSYFKSSALSSSVAFWSFSWALMTLGFLWGDLINGESAIRSMMFLVNYQAITRTGRFTHCRN